MWGRWTLRILGLLLAVGHVLLLARRFAEGSIGEPIVLLRWLGAAGTLAAAEILRRRGIVPWRGRTGLAFLLVILLLHAGAAPTALASLPLALPAATISLFAVTALAARALTGLRGELLALDLAVAARPAFAEPPRRKRSRGFARPFASRPPPSSAPQPA